MLRIVRKTNLIVKFVKLFTYQPHEWKKECSVNWIIRLMLSLSILPKVIQLSGGNCIKKWRYNLSRLIIYWQIRKSDKGGKGRTETKMTLYLWHERVLTDDPDDKGVAGEGGERQDGVDDGQEDDGEDRVLAEVHLACGHVANGA